MTRVSGFLFYNIRRYTKSVYYLQYVRTCLLDDEDKTGADDTEDEDSELHQDVGGFRAEGCLAEGFDEVLEHHRSHRVQTRRQGAVCSE